MTAPVRIQRRRSKGWRMPPNTVYVGRPTKWGNPIKISPSWILPSYYNVADLLYEDRRKAHQYAVDLYRDLATEYFSVELLVELRGKNLCCWCPSDFPCHADVLLELSNKD